MPSCSAIVAWLSFRSRRSRRNLPPRRASLLMANFCHSHYIFTFVNSKSVKCFPFLFYITITYCADRQCKALSEASVKQEFLEMSKSLHNVADRFAGIRRDYSAQDVERLRGSLRLRHPLPDL